MLPRQYIPEDNSEHHTRRRENLKPLQIYFAVVPMNLNSAAVILVLLFAFIVQVSLPYKRVGTTKVLYFICLWTSLSGGSKLAAIASDWSAAG
jgi:hypothetical protein